MKQPVVIGSLALVFVLGIRALMAFADAPSGDLSSMNVALEQYRDDLLSHDIHRLSKWYLPPADVNLLAFGDLAAAQNDLAKVIAEKWGPDFLVHNRMQSAAINLFDSVIAYSFANLRFGADTTHAQADVTMELAGLPAQTFTQDLFFASGHWYVVQARERFGHTSEDKARLDAMTKRTQEQSKLVSAIATAIQHTDVNPQELLDALSKMGEEYIRDLQAIQQAGPEVAVN